MNNIKVSCIIPVYNVERYLKKTLDSLLVQTLEEIEIICINDGSQDQSFDILCEYQNNDKRVIAINMLDHKGAATSRNEGIKRVRGDYVIFLDADDFFNNGMLKDAYDLAIDQSADLVIFGYERVFIKTEENGDEKEYKSVISSHKYSVYEKKDFSIDLLKKVEHVPWNKLVRREFLEKSGILFQEIPTNNDVFFSLAITLLSSKTVILDKVLMKHYSGWKNSLTQQRLNKQSNLVKAYSCFFRFFKQMDTQVISHEAILDYILDDIATYLRTDGIARYVKEEECRNLLQDSILIPAILDSLGKKNIKEHNICFAKALLNYEDVIDQNKYVYCLDAITLIIEKAHKKDQKVALWGCGIRGKKLIDLFLQKKIQIDFIIDMDKQKQGTFYNSYQIYDYFMIQDEVNVILVSNPGFVKEIINTAKGKRVINIDDL